MRTLVVMPCFHEIEAKILSGLELMYRDINFYEMLQ